MAKSQRPKGAETKNSKDFVVWTVLLSFLLVGSGVVLYSLGDDEAKIQIPDNAFDDVRPRAERASREIGPNAVLMPRNQASTGSGPRESGSENSPSLSNGARSETLQKAMDLIDRGQWPDAEPLLIAELQRDPRNLEALKELALLQIIDKNQPALATPYLEEAIRIDPTDNSAMLELISVYNETQNYAVGVQFLKSIPETDENRGMIKASLGNLLAGAGNNTEALSLLKSAVYEAGNTSFAARKDLAETYEALGRADEANQEYMNIINGSYKPDQQRRAKIDMAKNLGAQRRYAEAYSLLESLISANPKDKQASRVLSDLQMQASR